MQWVRGAGGGEEGEMKVERGGSGLKRRRRKGQISDEHSVLCSRALKNVRTVADDPNGVSPLVHPPRPTHVRPLWSRQIRDVTSR